VCEIEMAGGVPSGFITLPCMPDTLLVAFQRTVGRDQETVLPSHMPGLCFAPRVSIT
jgi:hypothetical protein